MKLSRVPAIQCGVWALLVAVWVLPAFAQAPDAEAVLPPELVVPQTPDLGRQAELLEQILAAASAEKPRGGGGLLGGLRSLFSPRPQKIIIPAEELRANAEALRGSQIEVHGVLAVEGADLVFATSQGDVGIDLGGGTRPTGFPDKDLAWMPAKAMGFLEMPFGEPVLRVTLLEPSAALASLRLARVLEEQGKIREAVEAYDKAATELRKTPLPWAAFASTEAGWLAYHRLRDSGSANKHLYNAWTLYATVGRKGDPLFDTWVPSPNGNQWKRMPVAEAVGPLLDSVGRESFWYRLVDFFVTLGGGSAALGVVLLALATRLGIHPLTRKQLSSMEAMRKLQPQIKALQEEFKDDKQRFQQEMWRVWQENGVNPLGGCWPMLIQMPILIFVYQGIRRYIVKFSTSGFLWIDNLAMPDLALLVAYTASMVLFQKMANRMQPMPADEKQRQQQQMMTWMMPLMFFFFFKTLPSAFILYWLASNLIYFGEQWLFRRSAERVEAADGSPAVPSPPRKRSRFMDLMAAASERAEQASQARDAAPAPKPESPNPRPTRRKRRKRKR